MNHVFEQRAAALQKALERGRDPRAAARFRGYANTREEAMNADDLKTQNPDLFARVLEIGATAERQRICSHLDAGNDSGNTTLASECIASGAALSASLMNQHLTHAFATGHVSKSAQSPRFADPNKLGGSPGLGPLLPLEAKGPPASVPSAELDRSVELLKSHSPQRFEELSAQGATTERERVMLHLNAGAQSGNVYLSDVCVRSGAAFGRVLMKEHLDFALRTKAINLHQEEADANAAVLAGAANCGGEQLDEIDRVAAELTKIRGKAAE